VPDYGKCLTMASAWLWQVPDYGKCLTMASAWLWQVSDYGKCLTMASAWLLQVPDYGKPRFVWPALWVVTQEYKREKDTTLERAWIGIAW
jgi:hypothetical protein